MLALILSGRWPSAYNDFSLSVASLTDVLRPANEKSHVCLFFKGTGKSNDVGSPIFANLSMEAPPEGIRSMSKILAILSYASPALQMISSVCIEKKLLFKIYAYQVHHLESCRAGCTYPNPQQQGANCGPQKPANIGMET